MIDLFVDDLELLSIDTIFEGFRLVFYNKAKDEKLHLILDGDNSVELFKKLRRKLETHKYIPRYYTEKEAINKLGVNLEENYE